MVSDRQRRRRRAIELQWRSCWDDEDGYNPSMNLETVARMARDLYRGTIPLEVCQDACLDLRPPLRWREWLEWTWTINRLAECMPLSIVPGTMVYDWLSSIGALDGMGTPAWFTSLCDAFGIPPVMVEVEERVWEFDDFEETSQLQWLPPSPLLALEVLRTALLALELPEPMPLICLNPGSPLYLDERRIAGAVHLHHPYATRYRLRIRERDWVELRIVRL